MITGTSEASTVPAAATAAPGRDPGAGSANGLTSDFETFLKMLTAQARYQDPLEPIDSTEYAAQLAQFSMVEQQVQTNDTLTALFSQFGIQNAATLSAWVGMEARAETPVYFNGSPVTISAAPAAQADQAFLVVRDSDGAEVQRLSIPESGGPILWAGADESGALFPAGVYSFEVESRSNGTVLGTEHAAVYSRVAEAQIDGAEVTLVLEGGLPIPASAVTALRDPV